MIIDHHESEICGRAFSFQDVQQGTVATYRWLRPADREEGLFGTSQSQYRKQNEKERERAKKYKNVPRSIGFR